MKNLSAKEQVAAIRAAYPDTVSFYVGLRRRHEHTYCVGGAVNMFVNGICEKDATRVQRFPTVDRFALTLRRVNPTLTREQAKSHAADIIRNNDGFRAQAKDDAWAALEQALETA